MKKSIFRICVIFFVLALASSAFAAKESLTCDNTSGGISLSSTVYGAAQTAFISVEQAEIRFTLDGSDPSTNGHLLEPGMWISLGRAEQIWGFRCNRTGGTSGIIKAEYFKN